MINEVSNECLPPSNHILFPHSNSRTVEVSAVQSKSLFNGFIRNEGDSPLSIGIELDELDVAKLNEELPNSFSSGVSKASDVNLLVY